MAGLGRKTWSRETLSSTELQGYLQDQVVMVFASAAARTTAVPAPTRGMVSFLSDVGRFDRHNGTTWSPLAGRAIIRQGYTPVSTSIPSGAFRESGVADGPVMAGFTTYWPQRVLLLSRFRVGVASAGVGAALPSLRLNGSTLRSGTVRTTDQDNFLMAYADVSAATHTLAVRVDAFGGACTWVETDVAVLEAVAE